MSGPYDDLAIFARTRAKARVAVVVVLEGAKGDGFAVATEGQPMLPAALAAVLHGLADEIYREEIDLARRVRIHIKADGD